MIAQLERALRDRLKTVRQDKNLKVAIETYGGQLDDDLLADIAQRAPAIYVTFAGMTPAPRKVRGSNSFDATIALIVAGKSIDDEQARGGGRAGKIVGAFDLIDLSLFALDGFAPDGVDRAFEPTRVSNLFSAKVRREYLAIYAFAWTTRFTTTGNFDADALDDFKTIHVSSSVGGPDSPAIEADIAQQEDDG
ncbi:phage protein Gp37 [Thalassospira sp. MCCC 1A01428]|uniref:phage protein Gp37 n=1 Tax=Thalassospira sp. MCCC 1A01428 TaxID=1470575 RepID=UPI000A1EB12A|nr:phage protein Gp37 [Thalassospira sp. MCCC 1A01428]OSQ41668.1 hypothetical protein THS27_18330 [Thalassospira sp. MCCC 1A01428]